MVTNGTARFVTLVPDKGVNAEVDLRLESGVLIIQPMHQLAKYPLQQLISQKLEDELEINWGKPMGDEEW